jgi:hypothetical protein
MVPEGRRLFPSLSVEENLSIVGLVRAKAEAIYFDGKAIDAFQKGGFASPIRADDGHGLVPFDPEIDIKKCLEITVECG